MPEHLRALFVIMTLAIVVFALARKLCADTIGGDTFNRWRNLWLALTLAAFLSHSFWVYAALAALILVVAARRDDNPAALFFASLFAVPAAGLQVPGFGVINYVITLNHLRILELCLLMPAALVLRSRGKAVAFGKLWPDRLLLLYATLVVALQLRDTTLTDTLRQGFYVSIDVLLPYYVISRSLHRLDAFRQAVAAFLLAASLLAAFAVFEAVRHWNLYSAAVQALGADMSYGNYLGRGGILRARTSAGHSIALGYVMAVATGLYLYWQGAVHGGFLRRIGWLGLLTGLIAPLSRGPWVGAAVIAGVFLSSGRAALRKLTLLALGGVLTVALMASLPGGQKILDFLPFIGTIDKTNIDYRERLIDNALIVFQRNPWFGSADYRSAPEMEVLRQGQGIIDVVNTYIGVTLEYGMAGLCLFVGFFLTVLSGIRKALRSFSDPDEETARLGRALFASLTGIMVIIFTVSSITVIPIVYWSVAGMGVAYAQMVRERMKSAAG